MAQKIDNDEDVIRPLCIKLPQMIGHVNMLNTLIVIRQCLFKVGDNKLLKKYYKIWEKISNLMNRI